MYILSCTNCHDLWWLYPDQLYRGYLYLHNCNTNIYTQVIYRNVIDRVGSKVEENSLSLTLGNKSDLEKVLISTDQAFLAW